MSGRSSSIKVSDDAELLLYMRERLDYDPATGALTRKEGFTGVLAGQRVGSVDSTGKRQAVFLGKRYQVAHLVWLWETGALPRARLSKKNRDLLDDRFENLTTEASEAAPRVFARSSLQKAFLRKTRARFGRVIDLSGVVYINRETPVRLTCRVHGPFERKPESILGSTHGCPTCCVEHARAQAIKTPEERLETQRAYQRAHRVRLRERYSKGVTVGQWQATCASFTNSAGQVCCSYCKRPCKPTMDHIVPVSRGGRHEPHNVVPACPSCNSSKFNHLLNEWPRVTALLAQDEIATFIARSQGAQGQ